MPTTAPAAAPTRTTARPPLDTSAWSTERARIQGAVANGDFSSLIGLQRRTRELAQGPGAQAAPTNDPAAAAAAAARADAVERLQQLAAQAGSDPGPNTRRALAIAVASVERTGSLGYADSARTTLAMAVDRGTVPAGSAADLRATIDRLDGTMGRIAALAQDPLTVSDPTKLATFQRRMGAAQAAARGVEQLLASSAPARADLDAVSKAGLHMSDGHLVRDVLAALRS